MSGYGWYHGFNEAVYTQIAYGYRADFWTPTYHGVPFFDTGPLTTYLMLFTGSALGWSAASVRFASLLAYPITVWAAWRAGEGFYGKGKGKIAALLVACSPFVLLWFGRAQTDAWMTAGVLLVLAGVATREGWKRAVCVVGGTALGVLSKQPAILVSGLVAMFEVTKWNNKKSIVQNVTEHRLLLYVAIGFVAGMLWWLTMAYLHPVAFEAAVDFHAHERTSFAENWAWTAVALFIGPGAVLFFPWLARKPNALLAVTALAYGVFALVNSPIGHEYYALPAIAVLCVMAANWKWDKALLTVCVVASLILAGLLLAWSGDLDDRQSQEMGLVISNPDVNRSQLVPLSETVQAPNRLVPQLELYSGRTVNNTSDNHTGAFIISWESLPCPEIWRTDATIRNPPLRLYDCRVSA